jgi:hypothetical protein
MSMSSRTRNALNIVKRVNPGRRIAPNARTVTNITRATMDTAIVISAILP